MYVAKRNLIELVERILELKPNTILTAIHKEPQQTNRKAGLWERHKLMKLYCEQNDRKIRFDINWLSVGSLEWINNTVICVIYSLVMCKLFAHNDISTKAKFPVSSIKHFRCVLLYIYIYIYISYKIIFKVFFYDTRVIATSKMLLLWFCASIKISIGTSLPSWQWFLNKTKQPYAWVPSPPCY